MPRTRPCSYCGKPIPDSGIFGLPTYTDVPENHAEDCLVREIMEIHQVVASAATLTPDYGRDYLEFYPEANGTNGPGNPSTSQVCIDGWFTSAQLRNIATELDRLEAKLKESPEGHSLSEGK